MFEKLGGRKLTLAFLFGALVICNEVFGWKISEDALIMIGAGFGAFITTEGLADIVSRFKNTEINFNDEDEEDEE